MRKSLAPLTRWHYLPKRLEQGTFSWPKPSQPYQATLKLSLQAFKHIIDRVDLRDGSLRPWYKEK